MSKRLCNLVNEFLLAYDVLQLFFLVVLGGVTPQIDE
jgi:hypothetical protein